MSEGRTTSRTLIDQVRNRDQIAWQRFMYLYSPLVRWWCGRWGLRGADADDVIQEVFQGVATNLAAFRRDRPTDSFRGWLRSITRHKSLDFIRSRNRHAMPAGGTDAHMALEQFADPESDPAEEPATEVSGLYHRAMALVQSEFEPQTWKAFWRAAVDGHPVDLIAKEMGVTPAAIRKAKSRVLRRLKEEVGDVVDE